VDFGLLTAKGWHHITLPAITLAIFQLTLIMRLVRAEMLEVLRTDYIKFARARGLSNRAIHFGHALKNTLVPVMTITGLQLGGLIAFAIITETVFQWPGMGLLFIQAVTFADIPVMAAYLCLIALIFVVINLVVDLLYFVVDPACAWARREGTDAGPLMQPAGWAGRLRTSRSFTRADGALRRDLHAHPELGFEEVYTAAASRRLIKGRAAQRSGKHDGPARRHGRAAHDRAQRLRWKSGKSGLMHGCGHDGHTAMLVGAARYLAETRNFDGTAVLIFQPGEEGLPAPRP
jgi:hypothetical protein